MFLFLKKICYVVSMFLHASSSDISLDVTICVVMHFVLFLIWQHMLKGKKQMCHLQFSERVHS